MIKQSINKRFNRSIILTVVVILLLFSVGVVIYGVNRMNSKLRGQLNYITSMGKTSLHEAVWNMDDNAIDEILNAMFHNEDVVYLDVVIDEEVTVKKVRVEFENNEFNFFEESPQFISATSQVLNEGEEIAKIRVVVSRANLKKELTAQVIYIIIFVLFLLVVIILRSIAVMRKYIFKPILELEDSASSIADGNLDAVIHHETDDEIGNLGRSFDRMRVSLKRHVSDLNSAKQELEKRVEERTSELSKSTEELKKAKEDAEASSIFKAALNDLSDIMRGEHEIKEMANKVTRYLAEFLKLPLAGFFAKNSRGVFGRVADFGYYRKEGLTDTFESGSGIIGQAAADGKPITLKDIPEHARFAFGFGKAAPNVIYVYPLIHNNQTIGILELGSFKDFSLTQIDWIKQAARSITQVLKSFLLVSDLKKILLIEWNESYDVGIKQFNDQHKKWFSFVNNLSNVISNKEQSKDKMGEVLDGLLDYTQTHLAEEEEVMRKHSYPDYEAHKKAHDELVSEVKDIRARFITKKETLNTEVIVYLINWLRTHIQKTDKSYGPFLNQKGII